MRFFIIFLIIPMVSTKAIQQGKEYQYKIKDSTKHGYNKRLVVQKTKNVAEQPLFRGFGNLKVDTFKQIPLVGPANKNTPAITLESDTTTQSPRYTTKKQTASTITDNTSTASFASQSSYVTNNANNDHLATTAITNADTTTEWDTTQQSIIATNSLVSDVESTATPSTYIDVDFTDKFTPDALEDKISSTSLKPSTTSLIHTAVSSNGLHEGSSSQTISTNTHTTTGVSGENHEPVSTDTLDNNDFSTTIALTAKKSTDKTITFSKGLEYRESLPTTLPSTTADETIKIDDTTHSTVFTDVSLTNTSPGSLRSSTTFDEGINIESTIQTTRSTTIEITTTQGITTVSDETTEATENDDISTTVMLITTSDITTERKSIDQTTVFSNIIDNNNSLATKLTSTTADDTTESNANSQSTTFTDRSKKKISSVSTTPSATSDPSVISKSTIPTIVTTDYQTETTQKLLTDSGVTPETFEKPHGLVSVATLDHDKLSSETILVTPSGVTTEAASIAKTTGFSSTLSNNVEWPTQLRTTDETPEIVLSTQSTHFTGLLDNKASLASTTTSGISDASIFTESVIQATTPTTEALAANTNVITERDSSGQTTISTDASIKHKNAILEVTSTTSENDFTTQSTILTNTVINNDDTTLETSSAISDTSTSNVQTTEPAATLGKTAVYPSPTISTNRDTTTESSLNTQQAASSVTSIDDNKNNVTSTAPMVIVSPNENAKNNSLVEAIDTTKVFVHTTAATSTKPISTTVGNQSPIQTSVNLNRSDNEIKLTTQIPTTPGDKNPNTNHKGRKERKPDTINFEFKAKTAKYAANEEERFALHLKEFIEAKFPSHDLWSIAKNLYEASVTSHSNSLLFESKKDYLYNVRTDSYLTKYGNEKIFTYPSLYQCSKAIRFCSANASYCEYHEGDPTSNVILTVPYGGDLSPANLVKRETGCLINGSCSHGKICKGLPAHPNCSVDDFENLHTKEMAQLLAKSLKRLTGKRPHIVILNLHHSLVDVERVKNAYDKNDAALKKTWYDFHQFVSYAKLSLNGKGLLVNMHASNEKNAADPSKESIMLGYSLSKEVMKNANSKKSSIRSLCNRTNMSLTEILHGEESLEYIMNEQGLRTFTSIEEEDRFGGFGGMVKLYGSYNGGLIDAIQLNITQNYTDVERMLFVEKLSRSLVQFLSIHYS